MMEIWADPFLSRNCHTIEVDSDSARFTLSIENVPSEKPKTGELRRSRSSRRAEAPHPAASWDLELIVSNSHAHRGDGAAGA